MTNAYWEAVRNHLAHDARSNGLVVDNYGALDRSYQERASRRELCTTYSWTVTDPDSVTFVSQHAGPVVVDPLAGTGWWAYLLGQNGITVHASDLNLADGIGSNPWHKQATTHVPVAQLDAVAAVQQSPATATLLLSWPPYDDPTGADLLAAYQGDRVIYIGESHGGCCGDSAMFQIFAEAWVEIAEHRPVQHYGLHDFITIYQRKDTL